MSVDWDDDDGLIDWDDDNDDDGLIDWDDDNDDDGWDSADDVKFTDEKGKVRLCSEMCSTCVFRPAKGGRLPGITNDRVRDLVESARRRDAPIICHATLGTPAPAVCRGFHDRYSTNLMRVMGRIGGIVETDPPVIKH